LVGLAVLAAACGGTATRKPEPLPPQAVSQQRPQPTPPPPTSTPIPPPPTLVVVDPGEPDLAADPSLAEAARREKERRRASEGPVAVITNKNLAEFAKGQRLTVASADAGAGEAEPAAVPGTGEDEARWRKRGLEIRQRWHDADSDIGRLEEESARLRRQFYSTDDPYVRDNQVKPEWDRVLAELDRARRDLASAPAELEAYLEEGRRAGALPGWLREGIELEPEPEPAKLEATDPQEPQVVDQDPGPP
jgi:hypothetical protein